MYQAQSTPFGENGFVIELDGPPHKDNQLEHNAEIMTAWQHSCMQLVIQGRLWDALYENEVSSGDEDMIIRILPSVDGKQGIVILWEERTADNWEG